MSNTVFICCISSSCKISQFYFWGLTGSGPSDPICGTDGECWARTGPSAQEMTVQYDPAWHRLQVSFPVAPANVVGPQRTASMCRLNMCASRKRTPCTPRPPPMRAPPHRPQRRRRNYSENQQYSAHAVSQQGEFGRHRKEMKRGLSWGFGLTHVDMTHACRALGSDDVCRSHGERYLQPVPVWVILDRIRSVTCEAQGSASLSWTLRDLRYF